MAEYTDTTYTLMERGMSRLIKEQTSGTIWYRGAIVTPHGIVNVAYSEPRSTLMEFAFDGVHYLRRWECQFQPRYLVTLARRFALDVAGS